MLFKKNIIVGTFLLFHLGLTAVALAEDWNIGSEASYRVEYDDNRTLKTTDQDSVVGHILDLKTDLSAEYDTAEIEIKPRISFERYTGTASEDGQLDSDNGYLDMMASYFTEASRWGLNANYTRDNTLTSELEESGFVQTSKRREKWNIDPQWTKELTELTTFDLRLSQTSVDYQDSAKTGLVDYDIKSAQAAIAYSISESTTLNSTLYGSRMEATTIGDKSDNYGFSLGLEYTNKQALDWGLQLGMRQIDYSVDVGANGTLDDSDSGYTADVKFAKEYEYTRWKLNLSRSVIPSGVGRLLQQNKIEVRNGYELTQTLRTNLTVTALKNKEIQEGENAQNRDYLNTGVSLYWKITTGWSIYGAYAYTLSKYQTSTSSATSNSVQLTLMYTDLKN